MGMPEHRCKECGAVWHGWGAGKICPKCGGKLELVPENDANKNRPGLRYVELRVFRNLNFGSQL